MFHKIAETENRIFDKHVRYAIVNVLYRMIDMTLFQTVFLITRSHQSFYFCKNFVSADNFNRKKCDQA